jgi:hypothetical protein
MILDARVSCLPPKERANWGSTYEEDQTTAAIADVCTTKIEKARQKQISII